MLRKTLAPTPQAKQDRGRGTTRGASQNRGPPHTGAPTRTGQGSYWHLRRWLELHGAERGAALGAPRGNERCKTQSREHLSAWARQGCLHLQSPRHGSSARRTRGRAGGRTGGRTEGRTRGRIRGKTGGRAGGRQGEKASGGANARRQGHGRARTHDQTQGHSKLESKHLLKREGEEQTGEARQDHPDN